MYPRALYTGAFAILCISTHTLHALHWGVRHLILRALSNILPPLCTFESILKKERLKFQNFYKVNQQLKLKT